METVKKAIATTSANIYNQLRESDILITTKDFTKRSIKRLIIRLRKVDDPRMNGMILHELTDIVAIVFLATMCRSEKYT